jgi:preprotein translocase subunit YajC
MSLFDFMGIGNAIAEATQTAATTATTTTTPQTPMGGFLHMLPMLILFILVFYFLLVRPQTKRAKEQKKLISSIALGDEVMSAGGILGRIARLKDNFVVMTIAKGVDITVQKSSIVSVLPKGTLDFNDA